MWQKHGTREANLSERKKLEKDIRATLDAYDADSDFTLTIKSENGNSFTHSTGNSDETVPLGKHGESLFDN